MKKKIFICLILSFILGTFFIINLVSAASNEPIKLEYDFSQPIIEKVILNDLEYDRIIVEGLALSQIPGEPTLPFKTAKILIPQNAVVKKIIVNGAEKELAGNYNIFPGQKPRKLLMPDSAPISSPAQLPNKELYENDEFYPKKLYSEYEVGMLNGYRILLINLYPVSYSPKEKKIYYYTNMEIVVEYKFPRVLSETMKKDRVMYRETARDTNEIREFVDNKNSINLEKSYEKSSQTRETKITGGVILDFSNPDFVKEDESYDYIIITNNELKNSAEEYNFQTLKQSKEAKGLKVNIVTVEDIYSNYPGKDEAEKIRNFIKDAYVNWQITYVLLGGDADGEDVGGESGDNIVPVRLLWVKPTYDNDIGWQTMASDAYYSNLDGNFNYDNDKYYGEENDGENGGEVDFLAEVYIGRAPVDSVQELSNFVRKTLIYENASRNEEPWLRNTLMVGEDLYWSTASIYKEEIKEGSSNDGYTTEGFSNYGGFNINTLYDLVSYYGDPIDFEWPESDLINKINSGLSSMNHLGHASTCNVMRLCNAPESGGGYCSGEGLLDIDSLANEKPFFAYSQGCYPGAFDNWNYQGYYTTCDSAAEHFVNSQHGAFAVLMNSRYGWGTDYPSPNGASQRHDRLFFDAILGKNIKELGKANAYAKEGLIGYILQDNYPDGSPSGVMRGIYWETNLLGDPQVSFYTPPLPEHDLIVKSLNVASKTVFGKETKIDTTIKNQGLNAEKDIKVSLYFDDLLKETKTIPYLENDSSLILQFSIRPDSLGLNKISINVSNMPGEENINNNNKEKNIFVTSASLKDIYNVSVLDDNGNGFYDYLLFDVGVEVVVAGNYYTIVNMYTQDDEFVHLEFNDTYLEPGNQKISFNFDGSSIYRSKKNGPYKLVDLVLYNEEGYAIDYRYFAYTTPDYKYTDFEKPYSFLGETKDHVLDRDGNNLYDSLILEQEINVTKAEHYCIYADLYSQDSGEYIDSANELTYLETGIQKVTFYFEGPLIHRSRKDGPYKAVIRLVGDCEYISDNYMNEDGLDEKNFISAYYNYTQFENPYAFFNGVYSDYGEDQDGDEKYDYLTINLSIDVKKAGTYMYYGDLYKGWDRLALWEGYEYLQEGKHNVYLKFKGSDLRKLKQNGPYQLGYLYLYDDRRNIIDMIDPKYTTHAYHYDDFDTFKDVSGRIPYSEAIINEETNITVEIKNLGTENATNINASIYKVEDYNTTLIETKFIDTLCAPDMDCDSFKYINFSWIPRKVGPQYFKLIINYSEDERSSNNIYYAYITVLPKKDVSIYFVSDFSQNIIIDQEWTIPSNLYNAGLENANNISVSIYEGEYYGDENWTLIETKFIDFLPAADNIHLNFSWTPRKIGQRVLRLEANYSEDERLANNYQSHVINVVERSLIKNNGSSNIQGYLLLKVQKQEYDGWGDWEDYENILNDFASGNKRIISKGSYLDLKDIWDQQGDYSIQDPGYYRIYAALLDDDGQVIITDSKNKLEQYAEFGVYEVD